ncbi:MAG TPA: aminotransferase class V-fold PLP-dependent enzyme [Proteobacteria bacterium]|nr:cysteine desulfurase [bacterium BMS3Abin14]HDL53553.1 aminotransferase class V-fold PLP-dependent enzyme [Pseudomonadota bacterium]
MNTVYMDHLAATPLEPRVLEAMLPFLKGRFGNPMSVHSTGQEVLASVEQARAQVASFVNCSPREIIFTSSGSESNNTAVAGTACCPRRAGAEIIVSAVEHSSVLNTARSLSGQGIETRVIPVDKFAMVDPDDVKTAINDRTVMISIMHANGEVGTIQPIREIARIAREAGVPIHTDAMAATGQIPLDVQDLGVDLMSFSAQGLFGPKGAAALYVRKGTRMLPLLLGGVQEAGRRAGLTDVPAVVGFGEAARIASEEQTQWSSLMSDLRDHLIKGVLERTSEVELNGHTAQRLPGNAAFGIWYIEGESIILSLDMEGISASTGSSCTSRALKTSHVLTAMGQPPELAQGSVLFTLGKGNTAGDVDHLLDTIPGIVNRLRSISPLGRQAGTPPVR